MRAKRVESAARENDSLALAERIAPLLEDKSCVAAYLPTPREIDTFPIIELCASRGLFLAVPAWNPAKNAYDFVEFCKPLEKGPMRIPEPAEKRVVAAERLELFLVPALAFDRRGNRLGHGGGHYDRLLARQTNPLKTFVGIAFDWQISEFDLPNEPWDITMDFVVTPSEIIKI